MRLGDDIDAYVPHLRPHVQRRDHEAFFMISKRPLLDLSSEEVLLYDDIDGCKTVAEHEEVHADARNRLLRWWEASVVELIAPISVPASPHLVVVEPHMDDAALSVGGRLLLRRGRGRTTILSVVKWSNFTSYLTVGREFADVREITDLRQRESVLAARLLGAEHHCLDWTDAPLRFYPAERWSEATPEKFKHFPHVFTNMLPDPMDVSGLAEQLVQHLKVLAPDELWIPMGLGNHADHRTTRSACLIMLAEARGQFSGVPVSMYEELPYSATLDHASQIRDALANGGTRSVPNTEDITDVIEEKLRVVSVYASQFKLSYIEPGIRTLGEREAKEAGRFAEKSYRLEGSIHLPPEAQLSRECVGLTALQTAVAKLLVDRKRCRRLRVVVLPSGSLGNWKADSESLVSAFPNADIHAYVPEEMAWLAEEGGNDTLKLELVRRGMRGWLRVICREFFQFGTPTVVLWRGAYGADPLLRLKKLVNTLVRLLLPFRRLLFARSTWDLCLVVNDQLDASGIGRTRA